MGKIFKNLGQTPKIEYIVARLPDADVDFLNQERNGYIVRNFDQLLRDSSVLYSNVLYALISMLMPRGSKTKVLSARQRRKIPRRRAK
jgi:hypothetical protein